TDISISIFSANGQNLLASTYLGGSGTEYPHSIFAASNGDLYVFGRTESNNFPVTAGCFDNSFNGGTTDMFVARLNSTFTTLIASTYVGGNGLDGTNVVNSFTGTTQTRFSYADNGRGQIRLDGSGNVCVVSCTQSSNFPTTAGCFDNTLAGTQDAVVFKMNNTLTSQIYSTFVGGANFDAAFSLQIGSGNTLYVGGLTNSADFPTTAGTLHTTARGGVDGFLFRINATGTGLTSSTYLGTANKDGVYNVDVDNNGVYVYGLSTGGAYPVTAGVYSNANTAQFIHGLDLTLTTTIYSTTFGNGVNPNLSPTAFEVDTCGKIYAAGWGRCFDGGNNIGMPITVGAFQTTTDNCDFYFIVLEPLAASLRYGTYFGQNGGTADHVDGGTSLFSNNSTESGVVYQAVCASCGAATNGLPVTPSAYAPNDGSANCNNAVFKFDLETYAPGAAAIASSGSGCVGVPIAFTNNSTNALTYLWDFGDASTSTLTSPSHTYTAAGTYTVTLVAYNSTTCILTDTATTIVTITQPTVTVSLTSGTNPTCAGNSVTLTAAGANTYTWNPGALTGTSVVVTPATTTTYTVVGTVTATGCTSTTLFTVNVNPIPATPSASSNTPVCTGNTINLSTPAVAGATYSWTGPSAFTSALQNPTRPSATAAMAGTYSVTVTVGGCTSAAGTTAVVVNATPATPTASSNTPVCTGNTINLSTPAVAGATYSWTGPSAFTSALQNPTLPSATAAMAGTYSVTVTVAGCTSAAGTTAVVVNATPATPTASSNTPVCTGNTINL
ncbi:MAG: PKD domain-containing protein, partial [Bacteroidia bacterium]